MAAPSTTVWGSEVSYYNSTKDYTAKAKIGINVTVTNVDGSTAKAVIQVWFWSRYSAEDSSNTLYFDNNASSATTSQGAVNISAPSNSSWSTNNQVLIKTYTYSNLARKNSNTIVNCAAKLTGIGIVPDKTMTASTSYTIPALTGYTIKFDANGGTGAPSAMTKYYGENLVIPSTTPVKSGYTFLHWSTTINGTAYTYTSGQNFGHNQSATLYAVWSTSAFTVTYNANGDSVSNMPSNQTKNAGSTLTLSSAKPTRTDYTFVGWGTSATATTASYQPGGSYTANASITLYAIWKSNFNAPRIENLKLYRVAEDDTASPPTATDTGTCVYVYFEWYTDFTPSVVGARFKTTDATDWTACKFIASDEFTSTELANKSGVISTTLTKSDLLVDLDPDTNYDFGVIVTDEKSTTEITRTLTGNYYTIDFLNGGKGIAIGKSAENEGLDIAMDTTIDGSLTVKNIAITSVNPTTTTTDTQAIWKAKGTSNHYISLNNSVNGQPNQWAFLLNFVYGDNVHQIWLSQANGVMAHRGGNASSFATTWRVNLDSSNYSSYALPLSGGTTTGYVKLGNSVNALGYIRQHRDYFGFFSSSADAQANTNRLGWVGYNDTSNFSVINGQSSGSNITNKAWTTSSDRRLKKDIDNLSDVYINIWNELLPKIFSWNEVSSNDCYYHFGLIAQDVIAAFEKHGLDYKEYGFVNSFTLPEDNTEYYGIAYDEYHMLTSLVVRKQQEKINSLEERIEKLEKLILGQEE